MRKGGRKGGRKEGRRGIEGGGKGGVGVGGTSVDRKFVKDTVEERDES